MVDLYLVGGFNPSEKYESKLGWLFPTESNKQCSKPPTRYGLQINLWLGLWVYNSSNQQVLLPIKVELEHLLADEIAI